MVRRLGVWVFVLLAACGQPMDGVGSDAGDDAMARSVSLSLPVNRLIPLMATARQFPMGVLPTAGNNAYKFYVFGGSDGAGNSRSATERFDTATYTWPANVVLMATGVWGAAVGLEANGKDILVAGGVTVLSAGKATITGKIQEYVDQTDTWSTLSNVVPVGIGVADSGYLSDGGALFVNGGLGPLADTPSSNLGIVSILFKVTNSATTRLADPPIITAGNAFVKATVGGKTKYIQIGGYTGAVSVSAGGRILGIGTIAPLGSVVSSVESYDVTGNAWTKKTSMKYPRYGHRAVLLNNGLILVIGGYVTSSGTDNPTASCELYDPVADRWSTAGPLPVGQAYAAVVTLADNTVLAAGGDTAGTAAALYNPASNTWTNVGPMDSQNASGIASAAANTAGTSFTAKEYIVVGGNSAQGATKNATIYNLSQQNWSGAGTGAVLDAVALMNQSFHMTGSFTGTFDLKASDDNVNFDKVAENVSQNVYINLPTTARYFKLVCTAYAGGGLPLAWIAGVTHDSI